MSQDPEKTIVLFRRFRSKPYDIIALFPELPGDTIHPTMQSFMHLGQHGPASPHVIDWTRKAKPQEYADLLRELTSEPYDYVLDIRDRTPKDAADKRRKACHG